MKKYYSTKKIMSLLNKRKDNKVAKILATKSIDIEGLTQAILRENDITDYGSYYYGVTKNDYSHLKMIVQAGCCTDIQLVNDFCLYEAIQTNGVDLQLIESLLDEGANPSKIFVAFNKNLTNIRVGDNYCALNCLINDTTKRDILFLIMRKGLHIDKELFRHYNGARSIAIDDCYTNSANYYLVAGYDFPDMFLGMTAEQFFNNNVFDMTDSQFEASKIEVEQVALAARYGIARDLQKAKKEGKNTNKFIEEMKELDKKVCEQEKVLIEEISKIQLQTKTEHEEAKKNLAETEKMANSILAINDKKFEK